MPLPWLVGRQLDLFGPRVCPASRSVQPARASEPKTSGISGQCSARSSASADLQQSLESKLRARLDENGSPEYALTWKRWDMPSGLPICALRASARRISGNGSTGAPKGWTTPQAHDVSPRGRGQKARHGTKHGCADLNADAALAGWPTPRANDAEKRGVISEDSRNGLPGMAQNHIPAQMAARAGYRLNPGFSLWLMGYPIDWLCCGEAVMPLSRKSRRGS